MEIGSKDFYGMAKLLVPDVKPTGRLIFFEVKENEMRLLNRHLTKYINQICDINMFSLIKWISTVNNIEYYIWGQLMDQILHDNCHILP